MSPYLGARSGRIRGWTRLLTSKKKRLHPPHSLAIEEARSLLIQPTHSQPEALLPEDSKTASEIAEVGGYASISSAETNELKTTIVLRQYFGYFPPAILELRNAMQDAGDTLQEYRLKSSEQQREWIEKISSSLESPWRPCYEMLSSLAQALLKVLAFMPFCSPVLLKKILIRARRNFETYRATLAYEDARVLGETNSGLLYQLTYETMGSIECTQSFDAAIADLEGCFMPASEDRSQVLWPGVYAWARALVANRSFAEASVAKLLAVSIGPEANLENECRAFRSQLQPLVDEMLKLYPEVCKDHYSRFSLVYEACNRLKDVMRLQEFTLSKCKLELGQYHINTRFATTYLASTCCKLGRWRDAKLLQSALRNRQEGILGEWHPDTLSTVYDLAISLCRMGRFEDAESLQKRVYQGRKQTLGESHPETLTAMYSLASNYFEQNRWQEATDLHEIVLQTRRQVLGEQHADTLSSMHSLATKHREAGQSTEDLEATNLEVLGKRKDLLGPKHPDTLSSMFALASVYQRQGQWQKATQLAIEVLKTQEEVLGRDHTETLSTMRNLAGWYSVHGRLSEAISLRVKILESRKSVYGDNHYETLASMEELVSGYWTQGLWAQAEGLHVELLGAKKRVLGDDDSACLATSLDLAAHYMRQCRWREASLIFKEVLAIRLKGQELGAASPGARDIVCMRLTCLKFILTQYLFKQRQLDLAQRALALDVFVASPSVVSYTLDSDKGITKWYYFQSPLKL